MMIPSENVKSECQKVYDEAQIFFATIKRERDFGFKIFNAPPVYQTPFLFIGYQPGGSQASFEYEQSRNSHLTWPPEIEYLTASWALASCMRRTFAGTDTLERCVGMNANFLRYPNVVCYRRAMDCPSRTDVERFCLETVLRIISLVDPRKIMTIGFSTLELFGKLNLLRITPKGASSPERARSEIAKQSR